MTRASFVRWVFSVWVCSCWAVSARAQEVLGSRLAQREAEALPPDMAAEALPSELASALDPEGYTEAVDAAILAHELGHFEEARGQLEKAHAIFPNARTLRGLGKLAFELRDYLSAVEHFGAALRSNVRPLDERLRVEVESLLRSARDWVGEMYLLVDPVGATLRVDEVLVPSDTSGPLMLAVGPHLIEVRSDGFESAQRLVHVRGGESTQLHMVLKPIAKAVPQPSRSEPVAKRPARMRRTRWLSLGLATAAAAGAAVLLGVAAGRGPNAGKADGGTSDVVLKNP